MKYVSVRPHSRLEMCTTKLSGRATREYVFSAIIPPNSFFSKLSAASFFKRCYNKSMKKEVIVPSLLIAASLSFCVIPKGSRAAIEYGGNTYQAPFAASTTEKVGGLIDHVVKDELGASSTTDVAGITTGAKNIFVRLSDWLREKAGIDLGGIVKGIGSFFVTIFQFLFGLIKNAI